MYIHCTLYNVRIRVHVDVQPISLKTQARLAIPQDVVPTYCKQSCKAILRERAYKHTVTVGILRNILVVLRAWPVSFSLERSVRTLYTYIV